MGPVKNLLAATAVAILLPAAASAQQYGAPTRSDQSYGGYQQSDRQTYGDQRYGDQYDYGHPQGDWSRGRRYAFRGYPEFRPIERHIAEEIQQGLRDDTLDPDGAADLNAQLRQIRFHEMREYRVHGWNLPDSDRAAIRDELDQLDHYVDQTRLEP